MSKRIAILAAAAIALVGSSIAVAGDGHGKGTGHKKLAGWQQFHETCGAAPMTGSQAFAKGPGDPPAGKGSLEFRIGPNGDSYETIRYKRLYGVKLSRLTRLAYWTYVQRFGSGGQAVYIDLRIDNDNDGTPDDTLTFEPVYQTAQGAVVLNRWQRWNARAGLWWAESSGGPPPVFTLDSYVATHPDARVVNTDANTQGGFIVSAGCGGAAWTNFVGNVDELTIGVHGKTRTFDFDPVRGKEDRDDDRSRDDHDSDDDSSD